MAKKSFKPSEVPAKPGSSAKTEVVKTSSAMAHLAASDPPPTLEPPPVKASSVSEDGAGSGAGQMPILLENQETEIRYIVGSQLKPGDAVLPAQLDKKPEEDEEEDDDAED